MRYLGIALFAEGPTDHAFLGPLLGRLCLELCLQGGSSPVDVGPVHELHPPQALRDASREDRILEAARAARGEWNVLFIHGDGAGDPAGARRNLTDPAAGRIAAELGEDRHRSVAVVPVRETEAWMLADPDAVTTAFRTRKTPATLGIPARPRDVEGLQHPKQAVEAVFRVARGGRVSRRDRAVGRFSLIGEHARLDVLTEVPAFRELRSDLSAALEALRYIGPGG